MSLGEVGTIRGGAIEIGQSQRSFSDCVGDEEERVEKAQAVFNAFAKMEMRLKEYERAHVIYKV